MVLKVYDLSGEVVGKEEIEDSLLDKRINNDLLHQVMVTYLANQRQGTVSTKTRGEVSGSGRKPWRQKGTGRARVGSIRCPLWRKGGVVFGPKPRDFRKVLPKKMKRKVVASLLSEKIKKGNTFLFQSLELSLLKTKEVVKFLKKIPILGKILFLLTEKDEIKRAIRNLPEVKGVIWRDVNPYLLFWADKIVTTQNIFCLLKEQYLKPLI